MVPARGQIDALDVPGRLTIQNSADKELHGLVKALYAVDPIFGFDLHLFSFFFARRGVEVVFDHFAPGSPVGTVKNVLKL